MPIIYPTGKCFDDALDYIGHLVTVDATLAHSRSLLLVHGICLFPESQPEQAGQPYAHAWVEHEGRCWTQGLLDGECILMSAQMAEFHARLRVQQMTKYTVRQAWRRNLRSGHYGPWRKEYLALTKVKIEPPLQSVAR